MKTNALLSVLKQSVKMKTDDVCLAACIMVCLHVFTQVIVGTTTAMWQLKSSTNCGFLRSRKHNSRTKSLFCRFLIVDLCICDSSRDCSDAVELYCTCLKLHFTLLVLFLTVLLMFLGRLPLPTFYKFRSPILFLDVCLSIQPLQLFGAPFLTHSAHK